MSEYYISKKIALFSRIGQPFALESSEMAQKVFKMIKKRDKFKISQNTIWRIKP